MACNSHTFVFMPNATMMSRAVVPHLAKAYGTRWYMITTSSLDGKAMAQAMVTAGQAHGAKEPNTASGAMMRWSAS